MTKWKAAKEMSLRVGGLGGFFELQFLKKAEAVKEHRKKLNNIFVFYAPIDQQLML